jgi:hypothetical protein
MRYVRVRETIGRLVSWAWVPESELASGGPGGGITNNAPVNTIPVTVDVDGNLGPTGLTIDASSNLAVASTSTPDDGDPVLTLHVTEEGAAPLLEINSDGQGDYGFQDQDIGGPIFLDFHRNSDGARVIRLGSNGLEVLNAFSAGNDSGFVSIGFYGTPPVVRPEVPASPTAQDIVDVLKTLGLITQAS